MARVNHLIRNVGATVLYAAGVTRPSRIGRDELTIVTFHRFLPVDLRRQYPHPGLAVTPEVFAQFVEFFATNFDCRTVSDAVTAWQGGQRGPKPLLAITADDGQLDNFEYARPVLNRLGVPATFYAVVEATEQHCLLRHDRLGFYCQRILELKTHPVENLRPYLSRQPPSRYATAGVPNDPNSLPRDLAFRLAQVAKAMIPAEMEQMIDVLRSLAGDPQLPAWSNVMNWDQLKTLANDGHEIGSHTTTHAILLAQCAPDLPKELAGSRQRLEQMIGKPIRSLAYPNGDFDDATLRATAQAGYQSAVTTRMGRNRPGQNPHALLRFDLQQEHNQIRAGRLSPAVLCWRLNRTERVSL